MPLLGLFIFQTSDRKVKWFFFASFFGEILELRFVARDLGETLVIDSHIIQAFFAREYKRLMNLENGSFGWRKMID